MRSLSLLVLVSLFILIGTAFAQPEPGDIGIFFDPGGTQSTGTVLPSVPFLLYVVAFDVPGDIFGYEASMFTTSSPGLYFLLSAIVEPSASATNFGSPENWIVGTGVCYPASGPTRLVTLQILSFISEVDVLFCIQPSIPSDLVPATPGYVTCISPTDIRPFGLAQSGGGVYPDGCAVGNATQPGQPISASQESWSAVKARY